MAPFFPAAMLIDRAPFQPFHSSTSLLTTQTSSSISVASSTAIHVSTSNRDASSQLSQSNLIAGVAIATIAGILLLGLIGQYLYRGWRIRRNQTSESLSSSPSLDHQERGPRLSSSSSMRTLCEKVPEKSDKVPLSTLQEVNPVALSA